MLRILLTTACCIIVILAHSQQEIEDRFYRAYEINQQKRFSEALAEFKAILQIEPRHVNSHIMASWCYLAGGDITNAALHADNAFYLDPYYQSSYIAKAYVAYAKNDPDAEQYMNTAFWLSPDESIIQNTITDCNDLSAAGHYGNIFNSLSSSVRTMYFNRDKSFVNVGAEMNNAVAKLQQQDVNGAVTHLTRATSNLNFPLGYEQFKPLCLNQAGALLFYFNYRQEAIPFLEKALAEMPRFRELSTYVKTTLATKAAMCYLDQYDNEKAITLLSSYLRHATTLPDFAAFDKGQFLETLCGAELNGGRTEAFKEHALMLSNIRVQDRRMQAYFQATAFNHLGSYYQQLGMTADRQQVRQYYDKALSIATSNGLEDLAISIKSNLAQHYFSQGQHQQAYQLTIESAEWSISKKDYLGAEASYANLGGMYYMKNDFKNAVTYLRKSIDIVEKFRNDYNGETKLNFMARGATSYGFLAAALTESGDAEGLFEVQNLERGRSLSEMLNNQSLRKSVSLAEFQKLLMPDEAAVIYSNMGAGETIINVVTTSGSSALHSNRMELFVSLKQRYLDKLNAAANKKGYKPVTLDQGQAYQSHQLAYKINMNDYEDIMQLTRELLQNPDPALSNVKNEFLKGYYDFLIKPVAGKLAGYKKLIIMPDGILNFLPFESLMTREGRYLVEQFDIRYSQSAEVKRIIETRKYGQRSKSLLAMGGAIYQNMNETAEQIRGVDRMIELQGRADMNALQSKSQREVYAALGFAQMNYLPGTLNEVKAIERYFGGNATVYVGEQMTENFLKSLSQTGQLQNYKIVHLATHGFAIPQIPVLSGIAMCIFPQMQGGEDGYLTAPEIAKLNMQADLAVLSACETGLGKIYGGEGVAGLTQSLLVGGANRAIVSLWPVSDEGTMHFMTGLYDLTENQGKSYDEAVNVMKRRFIAGAFGQQFASTEIWAPFIHYGK